VAVASRRVTLAVALVVLNAALAFQNLWPTPAIYWAGTLSIEFAAAIAILALGRSNRGPSRAIVRVFAVVWVLLTFGRYADVTAPALYGREINLYWDLRYMPDVAAMIVKVSPWWLVLLAVAIAMTVVVLLYRLFAWALTRVAAATQNPIENRILAGVVGIVAVLFMVMQVPSVAARTAGVPVFAEPVTMTYVRQAEFLAGAVTGSARLPTSLPMNSDLSLVRGADVYLVFIEAYGAVAYERPDIAPGLVEPREQLAAAIHDTNRRVVSAFVESPTFGGSSWLAHISLMSGIEVNNPQTNAQLMTEKRDTIVTDFNNHGFTTVALMPGLRQRWPEGTFYGFNEIDDAAKLNYGGPEFGWFALPDQFTLAKFDAIIGNRPGRQPLFVFYPTISTHFPFSPTPPYQPDWTRMFDAHPYDGPSIVRAYAKQPDWTHFAPGYVDAVSYTYETLAGYLRLHADRDFVMVVLGDHQPAAAVSGEGAPWDVPVHVIASRPAILERLTARGFREGLTPVRPRLSTMSRLLSMLLDAFGDRD
jgi:Sulfatase